MEKRGSKIGKFFKSKTVAGIFAGTAFLGGVIFSDFSFTGSTINKTPTTTTLSLIGLALIVCSLILTYYISKR